MSFPVSLRRALAGHPWLYWSFVAAIAVATVAVVARAGARAEAAQRRWGEAVPVFVATRELARGERIAQADVAMRHWPRPLVPDGAVRAAPIGQTTAALVASGEPIVAGRLAPSGSGPLAGQIGPRQRAIAIALSELAIRVVPGDSVDLIAAFGDAPATVIARNATVLDVDEAGVTVAIDELEAAAVAASVSAGVVVIAVVGSNDQRSPAAATTSTARPNATR